ncbi:MAG TPA: hypothetical protein VK589_11925 [Chryseolinea sp.]|nr:hypothetical protein [Chryseolinea sp.]
MTTELTTEQKRMTAHTQSGVSFGRNAVFQITKADVEPDTVTNVQNASGKPWAIWGKKNDYPQTIIDENLAQETSSGALKFKIEAHFGKGIYFFKKEFPNGIEKITPIEVSELPEEIRSFYYNNDLVNFYQAIIQDFEWWNFFYVQYVPNISRNKIVRVNWLRTKDGRSGKRDPKTGKIPKYFFSGNWPNAQENIDIAELPVFDIRDPFKEVNAVHKHQLVSIDRDYYPTAYWQSNFRWLQVAKSIPSWILSNIKNSVNIKYHVEIPEKYFIDLYPENNYPSIDACLKARKEAEEELKRKIDECLAGEENASKIFYTKFAVDQNGQPLPGWKINELKNDIKDGSWLNAYDTSAAAICTAHSVDPSLSGLRMSKSLNVGSGSDTREKYNLHVQLRTTIPRQTTLEVWETVKRINGWDPSIHMGYRDIYLETTDKSKTGTVVENEESPTAPA